MITISMSQLVLQLPHSMAKGDTTRSNAPPQHIHIGVGAVGTSRWVPQQRQSTVQRPAAQLQLSACSRSEQLNQLPSQHDAARKGTTDARTIKDAPQAVSATLRTHSAAPSQPSAAAAVVSTPSNFSAIQRAQEAMHAQTISFMKSCTTPVINASVVSSSMPYSVLPQQHPPSLALADCLRCRQTAQLRFPPRQPHRPAHPPLPLDQVQGASADQVRQLCTIANEAASLDESTDDFLYRARSYLEKRFFSQVEQHWRNEQEKERKEMFEPIRSKKRVRSSKPPDNGPLNGATAGASAASSGDTVRPAKKSKAAHSHKSNAFASTSMTQMRPPPKPEAIIQHMRNSGVCAPMLHHLPAAAAWMQTQIT